MVVPVWSGILVQVEVAYCLSALADLSHHSRQWEWLVQLRKTLPDELNSKLDCLLPRVRWESMMTWPLLPEAWPHHNTGQVIVDRLYQLPEAELVSAICGWLMDDEDITAIRNDSTLPGKVMPAASPHQLAMLLGAVLEPRSVLADIAEVIPVLWRIAWPHYSQLQVKHDVQEMVHQPLSLDPELQQCCQLLSMDIPFDKLILAWSYFSHPHGEGVFAHQELLTVMTWFNNVEHAKSLVVHEALHVFISHHMQHLVTAGVVEQLKSFPALCTQHLTHAAQLPAWEQWIEEQIVAACHNLIIDTAGLSGQAEVLSDLQAELTELLRDRRSDVTPDVMGELLLAAAARG